MSGESKKQRVRTFSRNTALVLAALALWHSASLYQSPVILPGPWSTLRSLADFLRDGSFYRELAASLYRLLCGIGLSTLIGLLFGLLMGVSRTLESLLKPLVYGLQNIPPIIYMTLAMIWFGLNSRATIFIITIVSFPVFAVSIHEGFSEIDHRLIEMAGVFQFPRRKVLGTIILPSLSGYIKSGFIIMLGFSWKLLIMGEVLSAGTGIGAQLTDARMNLQTEKVFSLGIIIMVLCSLSQKTAELLNKPERRKKQRRQNAHQSQ